MINIAELLKNAPEGMKLYSPLLGEVEFKYTNDSKFGIVVQDSEECYRSFDKYGRYFTIYNNSECLLFPSKECRTWENFKLTKPKFKVGDNIKTGNTIETIAEVNHTIRSYYCESGRVIYFANQDLWHLVPKPHYDIKNFHAGMPVLVRETSLNVWQYVLFSHCYIGGDGSTRFNAGLVGFTQCIPFEGNKHLLGTTDMPDECYINW